MWTENIPIIRLLTPLQLISSCHLGYSYRHSEYDTSGAVPHMPLLDSISPEGWNHVVVHTTYDPEHEENKMFKASHNRFDNQVWTTCERGRAVRAVLVTSLDDLKKKVSL
jgi:hypothetical protein